MNTSSTPEAARLAGEKAYEQGDFLEAARQYQEAAERFRQAGDLIAAAEMANNRSVTLLQSGDALSALESVTGTPEIFAESGETRRQALALGNLAAALEALDRLPEAEEAYRQSAELLAQVGESELRASVMRSISTLQLRSGRQLEAVATMHAGLEGLEKPTARQRLVKKLLQMPFKFLARS